MKRQFLKKAIGIALGLSVISLCAAVHAEYNPKLLRIGFQKSVSLLTLLKADGTLEKRLSPQGSGSKCFESASRRQLIRGLKGGAIECCADG